MQPHCLAEAALARAEMLATADVAEGQASASDCGRANRTWCSTCSVSFSAYGDTGSGPFGVVGAGTFIYDLAAGRFRYDTWAIKTSPRFSSAILHSLRARCPISRARRTPWTGRRRAAWPHPRRWRFRSLLCRAMHRSRRARRRRTSSSGARRSPARAASTTLSTANPACRSGSASPAATRAGHQVCSLNVLVIVSI